MAVNFVCRCFNGNTGFLQNKQCRGWTSVYCVYHQLYATISVIWVPWWPIQANTYYAMWYIFLVRHNACKLIYSKRGTWMKSIVFINFFCFTCLMSGSIETLYMKTPHFVYMLYSISCSWAVSQFIVSLD